MASFILVVMKAMWTMSPSMILALPEMITDENGMNKIEQNTLG